MEHERNELELDDMQELRDRKNLKERRPYTSGESA